MPRAVSRMRRGMIPAACASCSFRGTLETASCVQISANERTSPMIVVDVRDMLPEQWRLGVETRMLVSASNGAAQLCIFEQWIAPGAGAATHTHPVAEVLTVREGEPKMWMDKRPVAVAARQPL